MVTKLAETGTSPLFILNSNSCKYIDNSMEALNKALALKPGDDLIKTALEKVMQFAADQTFQEPFFLDTRDENMDNTTMFESNILFKQNKRTRRLLPSRGLDKLDPNTTCSRMMELEEIEDNNNNSTKIIGSPKGL